MVVKKIAVRKVVAVMMMKKKRVGHPVRTVHQMTVVTLITVAAVIVVVILVQKPLLIRVHLNQQKYTYTALHMIIHLN